MPGAMVPPDCGSEGGVAVQEYLHVHTCEYMPTPVQA